MRGIRELLPLIFILTLAAALVYVSYYPDLPRIEAVNEAPRQTDGQGFQNPPVSNPQVIIVPPPAPSTSGLPAPAVEKATAGVLNTLVMMAFVPLGGLGIYLLLKYRRRVAEHVLAFAFGLVTVMAVAFFVEEAFILVESATGLWPETWCRALVWEGASIPSGIFVAKTAALGDVDGRGRRVALAMFCSVAGALMAAIVPAFVVFPLVLCMAVYDLYAVKHGPVRRIAEQRNALEGWVVCEVGGWGLGFGDLVFYSVLTSGVLSYTMVHISRFAFYDASWLVGVLTPWAVFALVTMAILIGVSRRIRSLEGKGLVPGLPIPIFAGCGAFGLCVLALQIVNYLGWGWFVPPL